MRDEPCGRVEPYLTDCIVIHFVGEKSVKCWFRDRKQCSTISMADSHLCEKHLAQPLTYAPL